MKDIKIKNKYVFFKFDGIKVSSINKGNSKTELTKEINKKNLIKKPQIMLMKIEKKKEWTPKTPINMIGGPIKISFIFMTLTDRLKIKKQEDKRAIQIIYYTLDYYEKNNIKSKDLKKIAELAFNNQLEKRLLAPKLINQINNKKIE